MSEKQKLELYIHIPFCASKCRYCDFLSGESTPEAQRAYVNQLIEEIRAQGQILPEYQLSSIFIGGGTPSILSGLQIQNIISAVYENFVVEADAEISIECNPGTLDATKLEYYREAGINRLSLGLQSADDEELKLLGRIHSYNDFLHSYELARAAHFDNINIDLMSGIPHQTLHKWRQSLKKVLRLHPEHISAYSLIIEPGTPFATLYGNEEGQKALPGEDEEREMYAETKTLLEEYGFTRYEISNYARPGKECRHNIGYWTNIDYLGVGLGASSKLKHHRFHSEERLERYMAVEMHCNLMPLYQDLVALTVADEMEEFMYLGLRMTRGVSGADFYDLFHFNMFDLFGEAIRKNTALGLLEVDTPMLRLTERGIDLSNRVFADFYQVLPRNQALFPEDPRNLF